MDCGSVVTMHIERMISVWRAFIGGLELSLNLRNGMCSWIIVNSVNLSLWTCLIVSPSHFFLTDDGEGGVMSYLKR